MIMKGLIFQTTPHNSVDMLMIFTKAKLDVID